MSQYDPLDGMGDEDLIDVLPKLLSTLEGRADEMLADHPEAVDVLLQRVDEADVAMMAREDTETVKRFHDFVWEVVAAKFDRYAMLRDAIDVSVRARYAAVDSPLNGHVITDASRGHIEGGSTDIENPDLRIEGPTETVVGLLTGTTDPVQGFLDGEFDMQGRIDAGYRLGEILKRASRSAST